MGYESSLFIAEPGQLTSFFAGWKPALEAPVTQTSVNPFTNEPMTFVIETAEYEDDDEYSPGCDWSRFREAALPNISQELSLGSLTKLGGVLGLVEPACRRVLSEPPGSETAVYELVPAFVEALATTSLDPALGRALRDDLDEENATALFVRLADLARKAREGQARLYLVEEI